MSELPASPRRDPRMSGMSTDSSEPGSSIRAREAAYVFRPGFIEARRGIEARTPL